MTDPLPAATHAATFTIFGVEVRCHVLQDGQRIIEAESMANLLRAMSEPRTGHHDPTGEIERFAKWQRGIE